MDENRRSYLKKDFVQGFPAFCGFEVEYVEFGRFGTRLNVREIHRQQDGFVHAGVTATMADHTAGYASFTTAPEDYRVLTIEFKINYLRPARGDILVCRSNVIKNGRKIKVVESDVFSIVEDEEIAVAKGLFTQTAVRLNNP